jgi:large conductance mechanosensitive channel protein
MLKGFKDFITRGNALDLATGVIIGAAFGGITKSLTEDVITPIIGMIGGQPGFSALTSAPSALVVWQVCLLIILPFNRFGRMARRRHPPRPDHRQRCCARFATPRAHG